MPETTSALDLSVRSGRRLPALLQCSVAECGLVCITMMLCHFGQSTDVAEMRRRFSISLKGTTLKGLMAVAEQVGLLARPLRIGVDRLPDLKLPAIIHWNLNHFVVLKSVSARGAILHDPASGRRRVTYAELNQSFTGVALELVPSPEFEVRSAAPKLRVRDLTGRVQGLFRGLSQILVLGLVLQLLAMLLPFYMQWIVDEALPSADAGLVATLGIGFLLLTVIQATLSAVRLWITTALSASFNFQWLGNVFTHLLKLPIAYFEQRHLGDIVSRFGSIRAIQNAVTTQMVEAVIDGGLVVLTVIAMLAYSGRLTLLAILAVVIYLLLRLCLYGALKHATADALVKGARQETLFLESVRGVQAIRLFGREAERRSAWLNALAAQTNVGIRLARLSISYQTAHNVLFGIERVGIIWLGALAVMNGSLTIGMLLAFFSFKDQFTQRISGLVDRIFELLMLRVHAERVSDIVMERIEPAERAQANGSSDEPLPTPDIELKNVSFRYSDADPYVIKDLSLIIPAGECVAITGVSGCGKTTLIKIILGLLKPTDGEVRVGGVNVRKLGLPRYRQMTGSVMQDDHLFAGPLSDNISFFDPQPDQARVAECARLAAISADIDAMPMGYMTLVGDLGSGLSGGQKQRVVLARALYRAPRILVLDEATSHLDVTNEQTINNAIERLQMTRIMVAHRADTVAMADRVIILDAGEVVYDEKASKPAPNVRATAHAGNPTPTILSSVTE